MKSWHVYLLAILLLASSVYAQDYSPPVFDNVVLFHDEADYDAPDFDNVILLHGESGNVTVAAEGARFVDVCSGTITIFHNENLSCQFNATSDFTNATNPLNWTVNDSRVSLAIGNDTAFLVDDPALEDYNLPGCWDISVAVLDNEDIDNTSLVYCINNSAPVINDGCADTHIFHNQDFNCSLNATDAEGDDIVWFVNDTRLTISDFNETGILFWNPSLSDYNADGGSDIEVIAGDTILNSSPDTVNIIVNNTAPTFNSSIANQTVNTIGDFSLVGDWFDIELDDASFTGNCTEFNYAVDNTSKTFNISYVSGTTNQSTRICEVVLNDTVLSSSEIFTVEFVNPVNVSIGENFTNGFVPDINVSQANISSIGNQTVYTEYSVEFVNMTENNSLWFVNNSGVVPGTIQVQRNETRVDVSIGCSVSFNLSNRVNLSGTNFTTIGSAPANGSILTSVWCWTDFLVLNITQPTNISFDMEIQVI